MFTHILLTLLGNWHLHTLVESVCVQLHVSSTDIVHDYWRSAGYFPLWNIHCYW